jgi:hypothetical protein
MTDVAKGLGMPAVDITDDPWTILATAKELQSKLPALINVYSCRMNWHVGIGTDGPPEWDRLNLMEKRLSELGYPHFRSVSSAKNMQQWSCCGKNNRSRYH